MKTQEEIENEEKCMQCEVTIERLRKALNKTEYKDLNDFLLSFLAVLAYVGFNIKEHKLEHMEETLVKVLMASIRGTTLDKVIFPKASDKKNEKPDVMYV